MKTSTARALPAPEMVLTWERDKQQNWRFPKRLWLTLKTEAANYNRRHTAELSVNEYAILKLAQRPVGEE